MIPKRVLDLAPASYDAYFTKIGPDRAMDLARELECLAIEAARLARYLDGRAQMGKDHDQARRYSNRTVRKVRNVLGFLQTYDLTY